MAGDVSTIDSKRNDTDKGGKPLSRVGNGFYGEDAEREGRGDGPKPLRPPPGSASLAAQREAIRVPPVEPLEQKALLPVCRVDNIVTDRERAYFAEFFQSRMLGATNPPAADKFSWLREYATPSGQKSDADGDKELKKLWAAIDEERGVDATGKRIHPPIWGPATQEAYKGFVRSIQDRVQPIIAQFASAGLQLPSDAPASLPSENGSRLSGAEYTSRIVDRKLKPDLGIDICQPPDHATTQFLFDAKAWEDKWDTTAGDIKNAATNCWIDDYITGHNLPDAMRHHQGEDPGVWRVAVGVLINEIERAGRTEQIINKLGLPIEPPEGYSVIKNADGSLVLSLNGLSGRLSDPANLIKLGRLMRWQDEVDPKIEAAMDQQKQQFIETVAWGDVPIRNVVTKSGDSIRMQARLKDGKLIGLYDPRKADQLPDGEKQDELKPGETAEDINMVAQRFSAHRDKSGDIVLSQSAQAQVAPGYAWYWHSAFAHNVGEPYQVAEKHLRPDAIVKVAIDGRSEYLLAKDLPALAVRQALMYHGSNLGSLVLDASMLLPGLQEASVAIKATASAGKAAGLVLSEGGRTALKDVAESVASDPMSIAKLYSQSTTNIALGASGFLNGPYFQETEAGRRLTTLRNLLFTAGMAHSVLGGLVSSSGRSGVDKLLEAFSSSAERSVGELSHKAMMVAQVPMLTNIATGLYQEIDRLIHPTNLRSALRNYFELPRRLVTSIGKSAAESEQPDDAVTSKRALNEYENLFVAAARRADDSGRQADKMSCLFDRARSLLSADVDPQEREILKRELAQNLVSFQPHELEYLQRLYGKEFSSQDVRDLEDSEARKRFPETVLKEASSILQKKDPSLAAASAVALLYLAHQSSDAAYESIASATAELPHLKNSLLDDAGRSKRSLQIEFSQSALKSRLGAAMEFIGNDGRGLAAASVLSKVGSLSVPEFCAVVQNVLQSPQSTSEDRRIALAEVAGMAGKINDQIIEDKVWQSSSALSSELRLAHIAREFGSTPDDLKTALRETARSDSDPQVAALAAATLYGVQAMQVAPQSAKEFLDRLGASTQRDGGSQASVELATGMLEAALAQLPPSNIDQRRLAGENLLLLAERTSPQEADRIQKEVGASLAESFLNADPQHLVDAADAFTPLLISKLQTSNPATLERVQRQAVQSLTNPGNYDPNKEQYLMNLIRMMPTILHGADQPTLISYYAAAKDLLLNTRPTYAELRVSVLRSLAELNCESAVKDGLLREVAAHDHYASVRLAAVETMRQLDPAGASELATQLIAKEDAPAVSDALQQIVEAGDQTDRSALARQAQEYIAAIRARYPKLEKFDQKAQDMWLHEKKLDLLKADQFRGAVSQVVRKELEKKNIMDDAQSDALGLRYQSDMVAFTQRIIDDAANAMAARRSDQFDALAILATQKDQSLDTQMARLVLFSIITGRNSPLPPQSEPIVFRNIKVDDFSVNGFHIEQLAYQEPQRSWSQDAARRLAETAKIGSSGRDLTASLVFMALRSGTGREERAILIRAWQDLVRPLESETGSVTAYTLKSAVPAALQQLVDSMNVN